MDEATPEQLQEQIDGLRKQHNAAANANTRNMEAIAKFGVMVAPDSLNRLRMDTFISYIFRRMGNISDEIREILTWQFEIEYEQRMAELLKEVKAEARKAVLGSGGQISEEQMRKMFGQNGGGSGFILP